jgi:2-polyprenyl-3-methyl-5-hydroxy-6-metoxy-1,4-benzoquinol methylase
MRSEPSLMGSPRAAGSIESVASATSVAAVEQPDIETSSADYARRFAGPAGKYLLSVQARTVATAIAYLAPGEVLDVGGAHGQLVEPLRAMGWRVTVHGTDRLCETNLRALHHRNDCAFLAGPLNALPVADRSFDLVIAVRLLPHVVAWQQLLGEMCRVARHAVVVDFPSKTGLNALTPLMFGLKKSIEGNTRQYASFSRMEIQRELLRHGFRYERQVKQFFLPMVMHRMAGGRLPLRAAESIFRFSGMTALAGSPVILRADRCTG